MERKQIEVIKVKNVSKIETGDYKTLSRILNVPRNTAISRFKRNNEKAVLCMLEIIRAKEKTIKKLSKIYG